MKLYQVDSFTDQPFAGNPAGVCLLDQPLPDATLQALAMEMNLSETAFVEARADGTYGLRWFTPTAEVDLCGHATLASAHILFSEAMVPFDAVLRFQTRSGELRVHQEGEWLVMDFPARPSEEVAVLPAYEAMIPGMTVLASAKDAYNIILELPDERAVREAVPEMETIAEHTDQGLIITARGDNHDFVSRFFGPNVGVPEDPVTGSAHCQLAPFWASRLEKNDFLAYQASQRGGEVRVSLQGDRCLIKGQAVTVFAGAWR